MATTMLKENTNERTEREMLVEKFVKSMKEHPKIMNISEVVDDGVTVCVYYTCKTFLMEDDLLSLQRIIDPQAKTHDPIRVVGYRGNYSLTTKIYP